MTYLDRNGKQLAIGDRVTTQHCVGRYGQTRRTTGTVAEIDRLHGVYLDSATGRVYVPDVFAFDHARGLMRGYKRHVDFEHGHEKWIELNETDGGAR